VSSGDVSLATESCQITYDESNLDFATPMVEVSPMVVEVSEAAAEASADVAM